MEIKKKEIVYSGYHKVGEYFYDINGQTITREVLMHPQSAAALVYDTYREVFVLVRQFRSGSEKEVTEVVAGTFDHPEEHPEETLKREVLEEAGYHIDRFKKLFEFYASPGYSAEKLHLFYAEASHQEHGGGGLDHENENIEVLYLSKEEFLAQHFEDAKTIIAQQAVLNGQAQFH